MEKKEFLGKMREAGSLCEATIPQLEAMIRHLRKAKEGLNILDDVEKRFPDEMETSSEDMKDMAELMADLKEKISKAEETVAALAYTIEDNTPYFD